MTTSSEIPHGTTNGYRRHECRCDACTDAQRASQREYRETTKRSRRSGEPAPDLSWMDAGACIGESPDIFFENVHLEEARRICRMCPVQSTCLDYALTQRIDHGVWGGLSERQRRRIRRQRRTAS